MLLGLFQTRSRAVIHFDDYSSEVATNVQKPTSGGMDGLTDIPALVGREGRDS